jgi:orotidine-5'-phosphate decarboxylase
MNPIEKYNQRVEQINSLVCVGLDSEISKIPAQFQNSQHPQFEFNKYII